MPSDLNVRITFIRVSNMHRKNDFAEVSKNLTRKDLKIILLD